MCAAACVILLMSSAFKVPVPLCHALFSVVSQPTHAGSDAHTAAACERCTTQCSPDMYCGEAVGHSRMLALGAYNDCHTFAITPEPTKHHATHIT